MIQYLLLAPVISFVLALAMYLIHAYMISNVIMGMTFALWLVLALLFVRQKRYALPHKVIRGMTMVSLLLSLFWDSMFFMSGDVVGPFWYRILGTISLNVSTVLWGIAWGKQITSHEKTNHKKSIGVYLLFGITIAVLAWETLDDWYRWDSYYYVSQLQYAATADFTLSHLGPMNLVNHLCSVYSMLALTLGTWIGELALGARLLNWCLAFWSASCFFRLLYKAAFPDRKGFATICTLIFIVSPWVSGFIGEVSLDYVGFCMIPVILWYLYDEDVVMTALAASILVFSKEPGVIVCGMMALTVWCQKVSQCTHQNNMRGLIINGWKSIWNGKVIAMGIPLVIWLMQYVRLSHWGATDSTHFFGISSGFLKQKIPTVLTLNFSWLVILLAVICFVSMKRKSAEEKMIPAWMTPMMVGTLAFLVFDLIFVTFNHGRYNLLLVPGLYMTLFYWLGKSGFGKQRTGIVMLVILGLLLGIQTFWQIDPISKWIERDVKIGETTIVTTNWNSGVNDFGDSIITNRQYTYLDETIDMVLEEIDYEEGKALVLPGCFNLFMGVEPEYIYYGIMGDYAFRNVDIYWDKDKGQRNFTTGELLKIYVMTEEFAKQDVSETLYYISVPWYQQDTELLKYYEQTNETTVSYRGWEITIYELGEKHGE